MPATTATASIDADDVSSAIETAEGNLTIAIEKLKYKFAPWSVKGQIINWMILNLDTVVHHSDLADFGLTGALSVELANLHRMS